MNSQVTSSITRLVPILAMAFTALAFLMGGLALALGAAIGGAVATMNWVFLRWLTVAITTGSMQKRAGVTFLLVLKFGVMIAVCWALIARWGIHPVGFAVGLGALVVAVFVGTAMSASTALTVATSEKS